MVSTCSLQARQQTLLTAVVEAGTPDSGVGGAGPPEAPPWALWPRLTGHASPAGLRRRDLTAP